MHLNRKECLLTEEREKKATLDVIKIGEVCFLLVTPISRRFFSAFEKS